MNIQQSWPKPVSDKQWAKVRELEAEGFSVKSVRNYPGDAGPTILMRKSEDYRVSVEQINPDGTIPGRVTLNQTS